MNVLLAALGVIGIAASGPLMAATSAPALTMSFWRTALGGAALGGAAGLRKRGELRALKRADLAGIGFAALMLAAHFGFWVSSLKLTSVASSTSLVCLQMAWVALFSRLRGVRVAPGVLAGIAVAFAGVAVISGFDFSLSPRAVLGDLLALLGGAFAALYTMAGARARRNLSTTTYAALCYGGCALVLLAACLLSGQQLTGFAPQVWLLILAVALLAQILGHTVFNHLLAVMSPIVVSLIILLEVPGAAILAAAFLRQSPPWGTYAGLGLILAGLAVVVLAQPSARKRKGPRGRGPFPDVS